MSSYTRKKKKEYKRERGKKKLREFVKFQKMNICWNLHLFRIFQFISKESVFTDLENKFESFENNIGFQTITRWAHNRRWKILFQDYKKIPKPYSKPKHFIFLNPTLTRTTYTVIVWVDLNRSYYKSLHKSGPCKKSFTCHKFYPFDGSVLCLMSSLI